MPKDRFKREKEFRTRSAIEFERLNWEVRRRYRRYSNVTASQNSLLGTENGETVKQELSTKSFSCSDCGQEIIATGEGQRRRQKTYCPKCGKVYKLHPGSATCEGEYISF